MGISLKEVSYSYEPKKKGIIYALENVNLEIESKGEMIAIVGETGSGKSTLVSLLNALKIATLGTVIINGMVVRKIRKRKENYNLIRKNVGLVFQFSDHQLFEETILKDVMFAPLNFGKTKEEAEKIAKSSLEKVHIDSNLYDKSPFQVSGGQKKLISIAGILAMESDCIIFDEPTAGIDPMTKRALLDLFKDLNEKEGKSIIIITHDMNIVNECAKRVIVMNDHKVAYDGTPYDLFNNNLELVEETKIGLPDTYMLIDLIEKTTGKKLDKHIKTIGEIAEVLLNE